MCEIALVVSLVIIGIFTAGFFGGGDTYSNLLIPIPAAIFAVITGIVALISYLWAPQRYLYYVAFVNYLLLILMTAEVIITTGQINSPYLALWMMLTIFAGVFGFFGLATVGVLINAILLYYFIFNPIPVTKEFLLVFLLGIETPILISYIIWHDKDTQEKHKSQAFNALAQQLSQIANKSEIVINAIDEGVVAIDEQGVIQLINPAAQKILGWSKDDALHLNYRSVIKLSDQNGKELDDTTSPIEQVLFSNRSLINNDLTLTSHSGKNMQVSLVISPLSDGANGAIVVFRDITLEKQEERQKAEFISTASHEMRTPVAAIEGYLALALNPNTAAIDDKARAYLDKAHEATKHLGGLFQDLLNVSKAEDGRLVPNPKPVDVVQLLRKIIEALMPRIDTKGLTVFFKPGGEGSPNEGGRVISPVYYALVDEGHLREITANLIDNAVKYTKEGSITIDVRGDDKKVLISISDTGIGIPPEDVGHLFQKFYRIDNSDTREIGGTGLGLFICRRLAEANNGKIWVESTYGKGSTFYVQLPRIDQSN